MKLTNRITIPSFIFLVLASGTFAQEPGPREQFQAAVAAFQKSATEDNARKLAEVSHQLDPAPAVPEDARFHALKGTAFVKQAGDAAAFAKAAAEFRAAIALAPWVGEYHYNLAVCEKSGGQFPAALAALKYASILARDAKESEDCLTLRADLEAAQELAVAKKAEEQKAAAAKAAEADTPQAREAALLQKVEGARFIEHNSHATTGISGQAYDEIFEIRNRTLLITVKIFLLTGGSIYGHRQPGEFVVDRIPYRNGSFTQSFNGFTTVYRIKADGQALIRVRESGYQNEIPRY